MNTKSTSVYLLLLRFGKIAFNIFTLMLTARYFGVGVEMDSWVIATTVITTIALSLWGPLNETFRAKFVLLREKEGELPTLARVRSLLLVVLLVTLVFSALLFVFVSDLSAVLAPSIQGDDRLGFTVLLLLLIPSFLISELVSIGTSILNAYNVFFLPEVMGIVTAVINIASIALLAPSVGIYSLLIALYLSSGLLLVVIALYLRKLQVPLLKGGVSLSWDQVKPFVYFSLPFFFPYIVGQFNTLLEKNLANQLGIGIVSVVNYSGQFRIILQSVIASVLTTMMVPLLSSAHARGDKRGFSALVLENLHLMFIFLAFVIPFLIAAAEPVVAFLYDRGEMDAASLASIVHLMRWYSGAVLVVIVYLIGGLALMSQERGKLYAFWGVAAQLLAIAVNFAFYRQWGALVFPLSLIVSHLLAGAWMLYKLSVDNRRQLLGYLLRFGLMMGLSTVVQVYLLERVLQVSQHLLVQLLLSGVVSLLVFAPLLFVFKLANFVKTHDVH